MVLGIIVVFIVFLLLSWRASSKNKSTTFGSATWADIWTIFNHDLFAKKGIEVGQIEGRLPVYYQDTHAISIGASGSGKGVNAILPNLLQTTRAFVIDPGGENTAIAAKSFRKRNLRFGCINIFGMFGEAPYELPAHGFNPLDYLEDSSSSFAADALVIAEMLTPRAGNEGGSAAYFKDAAQRIKRALIIHIKTFESIENQNLSTLYRYISCNAKEWQKLLDDMKANPACGGLVSQEANILERIEAQASEEFSAIMSTIQQDLSWLADPLIADKMSRSDVDFKSLKNGTKKQGGIISVVLPLEYMESHAAIPRLALACAMLEMQCKPYANEKVLFIIDETSSLGKLLRFPNWLATMRKYGAVIWSVWQSVAQVEDLYHKNWQTIIGNCGLIQILGVGDPKTGKYIEELLGKCTVNTLSVNGQGQRSTSQASRSLKFADELRRFPDDRQIVFIGNLDPIRLYKTPYWKNPSLEGLYYDNPYLGGKSQNPGSLDEIKTILGKVYYILIWWLAPSVPASFIYTALIAFLCWHYWEVIPWLLSFSF